MVFMKKIMKLIKERVPKDKKFLVLLGGSVPPADIHRLKEMGVDEVFSSRSKIEDIVGFIKNRVPSDSFSLS